MALILNLSTQNEKKKLRVRLILGSQVCVAIPLKFCHWNNKNDVFRENKWFHQKNDQWSWNKPRSSNVFDIHNLYESQGQPNWYHFGPFFIDIRWTLMKASWTVKASTSEEHELFCFKKDSSSDCTRDFKWLFLNNVYMVCEKTKKILWKNACFES